ELILGETNEDLDEIFTNESNKRSKIIDSINQDRMKLQILMINPKWAVLAASPRYFSNIRGSLFHDNKLKSHSFLIERSNVVRNYLGIQDNTWIDAKIYLTEYGAALWILLLERLIYDMNTNQNSDPDSYLKGVIKRAKLGKCCLSASLMMKIIKNPIAIKKLKDLEYREQKKFKFW
ncbi:MAG: hypothetical protein LBS95_00005, partial [Mycoplasmataceae bacterium]|nr:hypothetical protein [Mycoplasmataceae bacterium]